MALETIDYDYVREKARTQAKEDVKRLKEVSKEWSNGAIMTAINEELHNTESIEKRVELLEFKTEILESAVFGGFYNIHKD